jgi:hypothetical protein
VSEEARWETLEDIDAEARAKQLPPPSSDQLERWRGRRLLKAARQTSNYRGSIVEFPPGTAKQVVRLMELLGVKEKFEYAGWELWWEGYDVGEEWWKPKLEEAAKSADAGLKRIRRIVTLWSAGGSDTDLETEFDRLERETRARASSADRRPQRRKLGAKRRGRPRSRDHLKAVALLLVRRNRAKPRIALMAAQPQEDDHEWLLRSQL